jgi:hypothetical protein
LVTFEVAVEYILGVFDASKRAGTSVSDFVACEGLPFELFSIVMSEENGHLSRWCFSVVEAASKVIYTRSDYKKVLISQRSDAPTCGDFQLGSWMNPRLL